MQTNAPARSQDKPDACRAGPPRAAGPQTTRVQSRPDGGDGRAVVNLRQLRAWPLPPKLGTAQSLAVGAAILLAAALLRVALDYVVPGRLAFATYFPATAVAAYLAGTWGGFVVLIGGLVGSWVTWFGAANGNHVAIALVGDGVFAVTGTVLVLALAALREAVFELAERDERARVVNRELVHRNRNQYAVIMALAAQTLQRVGVGRDVVEVLTARIMALAQAQDLVSLDPQRPTCLAKLVEQVVAPMAPEPSRLASGGPMTGICADRVGGLALVLHELGTNALKYGAWSNDRGRVTVSWQRTDEGVTICWKEEGGPPPVTPAPNSGGLGTLLIENAIPDGTAEWRFEATGLTVLLHVRLKTTRTSTECDFV